MTHQTRWKTGGLRILAVLAASMLVLSATAAAVPVAPHEVYGTVTDQNGDAVDGVTVEAVYDGEVLASTTTDSDGYYELKVPDPNEDESGEEVTIRTSGTDGDDSATITWESAAVDERDLDVTVDYDTGDGTDGDTGDDTDDSDDTGGQTGGQTGDTDTTTEEPTTTEPGEGGEDETTTEPGEGGEDETTTETTEPGEGGEDETTTETTTEATTTSQQTPGFGFTVALVAVLGAALLAIRRRE